MLHDFNGPSSLLSRSPLLRGGVTPPPIQVCMTGVILISGNVRKSGMDEHGRWWSLIFIIVVVIAIVTVMMMIDVVEEALVTIIVIPLPHLFGKPHELLVDHRQWQSRQLLQSSLSSSSILGAATASSMDAWLLTAFSWVNCCSPPLLLLPVLITLLPDIVSLVPAFISGPICLCPGLTLLGFSTSLPPSLPSLPPQPCYP